MWVELIKEVGPYIGIMFFFIWRDYRREEKLVKQIDELNDFIQETLVGLIEKTTEALNER